ncbi:peptide-methionine (S)-S-oxide reductase MsrA [Mesobacterium pallidum]|uniref:peptide-methionine (S)-S-oxide reductase MsrA n=1 Tax=Mesobacterium pallidum TaxID=2872037 RepID=UPI001EE26CF8|nr:peptide-methionine (S)-S-oxide reductase MsrA [Mesobacterium pallidum]
MSTRLSTVKPILLAIAIALGLFARAHPVEAAASETLVVAGGCFWCVEADFEKVKGVREVVSGYTGGSVQNPTYKQVTRGGTGHYEAAEIRFDPSVVSRAQLLNLFFRSVDPTDAGGQFCDRGDSYRTAVFVSTQAQKTLAEQAKAEAQRALGQKIVTPVLTLGRFYEAEDYHQDYYKGSNRVLTRFGPIQQSDAYKRYRDACGRDQRVRQLWGDAAPFAGS